MLFQARKAAPSDTVPSATPPSGAAATDILPWWHPWLLLRGLWNVGLSLALGAAIGGIVVDIAAQIAARLFGGAWQNWSEDFAWAGWLLGAAIAFVSFMAYRMDDRVE